MLMFEWNALRVGDGVQVHDAMAPAFDLIDGTVVIVDSHHGRRQANDVGIRLSGSDGAEVVRPSYLSVHGPDHDGREQCWRCESATSPPPLRLHLVRPQTVQDR